MKKIIKYILIGLLVKARKAKFRLLSEIRYSGEAPIDNQPLYLQGSGKIVFGKNVSFGVNYSPMFYSHYCYINPRADSKIEFGNNIYINNNFCAISEGKGISIGDNTIIGFNVSIFDSDFHNIDSKLRLQGGHPTKKVTIGQNVWIGNNVTILKGVSIGNNSIIAIGAIVNKNIPENVIAAGVPAKVVKNI